VIWLALPAVAAAAYYLLALIAALKWRTSLLKEPRPSGSGLPPISILKPIRGRDPEFYDAIRSHATQDYPDFEILFGLSDPHDPAAKDILRLQDEFPHIPISLCHVATDAANTKAGVLAELAKRARHPVLLVNDSDIRVEPGYLRAVAAPLADPKVGMVTCLFRATGGSLAARDKGT
jgi:ceramide glucosyltransferase